MLHVVKVGAQIQIDDFGFLLDDRLRDSMDRFMGCSFRSVSIRSRLEVSFEDRFQNELESDFSNPAGTIGSEGLEKWMATIWKSFPKLALTREIYDENH